MRDHDVRTGRRRAFARRWLWPLALAAAAAHAADGPPPVPAGQALKAAATAPPTLLRKTEALIAAGDAGALGRHLALVKTDPDLAEPARERLLRRSLLGLAELKPDAATRREVEALRHYPGATRVWREEHGHAEPMILYDVGAAARFALQRWTESDAREQAAGALAARKPVPLEAYARGDPPSRQGIAEAFARADRAALEGQRDDLLAALAEGMDVGALAVEAAATLGDPALYEAVFVHGGDHDAVMAVQRLAGSPAGPAPVPLLLAATARPACASAALLALGRRASSDPAAAGALFAQLGGESGASAAAALARAEDPAIVARLAALLASTSDERTRRHALLGLRLSPGQAAAGHLRDFAADPATPPALRREVPAWLRD